MEMIAKGRLVVIMVMVRRVFIIVLILSVSAVVEADDHGFAMYFSPHHPHSHILPSLSSNSSEDFLKSIVKSIPKIIKGANEIIHQGENAVGLGSKQNKFESGKGASLQISPQKRGSISLIIPPPPPSLPHRPLPLFPPPPLPPPHGSNNVSVTFGFYLEKGVHLYPMEDYTYAVTRRYTNSEVGLFGLFGGFLSHEIPAYLQTSLFNAILMSPTYASDTVTAMRKGYRRTNKKILEKAKVEDGFGGLHASTAVTAILIRLGRQSNYKLVVGNVGDSRAVIYYKNGLAKQLSVDHVPSNEIERQAILKRGGHVKKSLGRGPCINGTFPLSRAFGGMSYRHFIGCEPHVVVEMIDSEIEFLVLASRPLWKVMSNQQVVESIREIKNAWKAAEHLTKQALNMPAYRRLDDISCVVVRFQ